MKNMDFEEPLDQNIFTTEDEKDILIEDQARTIHTMSAVIGVLLSAFIMYVGYQQGWLTDVYKHMHKLFTIENTTLK